MVTGRAPGYLTTSRKSDTRTKTGLSLLTVNTPGIAGVAQVGQTLTGLVGAWGPRPVKLSYQWEVNGMAIRGATEKTFKIPPTAVSKVITFSVTAKKSSYIGATRTSPGTAPVSR